MSDSLKIDSADDGAVDILKYDLKEITDKLKSDTQDFFNDTRKEIYDRFKKLKDDTNEEIQESISEFNIASKETKNILEENILDFINKNALTFRNELETQRNSFERDELVREKAFKILNEKIESLLPQASAVGISQAFADEKKSHKTSIIWYNSIFIAVILVMVAMPFVSYWTGYIANFFDSPGNEVDTTKFIISCVRLATIELPLLWLANLMSKKMQQHERIHEEYTHKYTAAMTFVGLSKEAKENTSLFGEDHIKRLTEGFRDAVYMNPSNTLDKNFKSESPFETITYLTKEIGPDTLKAIIDDVKK